MCLITVKPQNVELPKTDHLINGERSNSHGIGCCYWKKDSKEVIIKKDFLSIHEFNQWMVKNITPADALIIHFRWATHGLRDAGNRHPFPLVRDGKLLRETNLSCDKAIAHNGVITEYGIHEIYSDTQKFIMDIMSDETIRNNLQSLAIRRLIGEFIGRDRLAVLDNTGEIFLWGEYEKEKEVLYSNASYKDVIERYGWQNWHKQRGWTGNCYTEKQLPKHYQTEHQDSLVTCGSSAHTPTPLPYQAKCESCQAKGYVLLVLLEDNTSVALCKKCRKQARKGKINNFNIKKEADNDIEEIQCHSCDGFFPPDELVDYQTEGFKVCKECFKQFQSVN